MRDAVQHGLGTDGKLVFHTGIPYMFLRGLSLLVVGLTAGAAFAQTGQPAGEVNLEVLDSVEPTRAIPGLDPFGGALGAVSEEGVASPSVPPPATTGSVLLRETAASGNLALSSSEARVQAAAETLTLAKVLALAVRYNPDLRAVRAASRAGHQGVAVARSAWLPTVRLNLSRAATRTRTRPDQSEQPNPVALFNPVLREFGLDELPDTAPNPGQTTTQNLTTTELTASYNLYQSGQSTANLQRAYASVHRDHAAVEDAEQTLLLGVVTTYLDVVYRARVVELRGASLAFFEERLRETEAQFRIGDRTRADLKQAEAERDIAVADVTTAEAELETQRARFETLVGIPPDGLEEIAPPADLPSDAADARRMAEASHPTVRAAEHALRAAEHTVRAAKGAIGPRIDLQGTLSRQWLDTDPSLSSDGAVDDATVGIRMSLPLYEGGASSARLREAKWLRARSRHELEAAIREASRRVADAWNRLASARKQHVALTTAVAASKAALDSVRREADIDERTTREVLDAERTRVVRRIAALSAKRDIIVHAYSLLAAVGRLTARQLSIDGVPDLQQEAQDAANKLQPGLLSILDE